MMITMDMSSFEVDEINQEAEYDEEITRSGWNPAVDMMELEQLEHVTPDDSDTDSFAMTQQSSHDDVADVISEI
ncbi:MAG: hypothetical protein R8M11_03275, partial [Gallionella sp.]